jgi:hypothetical protein
MAERREWISVAEKLPELDEAVLCYGQGLQWIALRRGHGNPGNVWEHDGDLLPFGMFTHWMSLPEPPETEGG